jgi:DNA-binding transcriptional ArsR family regulator
VISLRSELRCRVLEYYFTHPGTTPYIHELARALSLDAGNLSREMARLERLRLVIGERRGPRKHYRLNRRNVLCGRLKRIVLRSARIIPWLQKAFEEIGGIQHACLYGPCVHRAHDQAVQLDVLILGSPATDGLTRSLRRLERRLGRKIECLILTREEFEALRENNDPILADILWKPKIALVPRSW